LRSRPPTEDLAGDGSCAARLRFSASIRLMSFDRVGAAEMPCLLSYPCFARNIDTGVPSLPTRVVSKCSTQLALAERAALVGSLAYDPDTDRMQISEGYAAIHGFPNGTTEIARAEWQADVHPEDRKRFEELRSRAFRERLDEYCPTRGRSSMDRRPPGDRQDRILRVLPALLG
jgi:hypothetical protein